VDISLSLADFRLPLNADMGLKAEDTKALRKLILNLAVPLYTCGSALHLMISF